MGDQFIETPHGRIFNYGASPNKQAVPISNWANPALWGGALPGAGDVAEIRGRVYYDLDQLDVPLACVVIPAGSALHIHEGRLNVGTLIVMEGGELFVTGDSEVLFNTQAFDANDTAQHGRGLIVLGDLKVAGAEKSIQAALASPPVAGSRVLTVVDADELEGWRPGDLLLLTQCYPDMAYYNPKPTCERITVESVSGNTVTLTAAVQGRYEPLGLPVMAINMTRPITFQSVNAAAPAHFIATHRATVSLAYCAFVDMGRTTLAPDSQIGRYPVHFHHMDMGPVLDGVSVYWTTPRSPVKWGVAVHGTHHSKLTRVAAAGAAHACIATEDGGEYGTILDTCVVADAQAVPGEFTGYGYWLNGCAGTAVRYCSAYLCSFGLGLPGLVASNTSYTVQEFPGQSPPGYTFYYNDLSIEDLYAFKGVCNGIDIWFEHKKGFRRVGGYPVVSHCVSSMPWSYDGSGPGVVAYDTDGVLVLQFTGYSSHVEHQSSSVLNIKNCTFHGAGPGVRVFAGGLVEVINCTFECNPSLRVGVTGGVGAGPLPGGTVQTVTATGCTFDDWTLDLTGTVDGSPSRAPIAGHVVTIDGTRHYWPEQAADAPCPANSEIPDDPVMLKLGAPVAGLTNAQAAAQWRWRPHPDNPYVAEYRPYSEVVGQPGWQVVAFLGEVKP